MAAPEFNATRPAPDWDLAEARRILLRLLRGHEVDIYLFGSRARGDAARYSDLDIAVMPRAPLPSGLLAEIRQALEDSNILYRVDLVDLARVDATFRDQVLREGRKWNA